MSSIMNAGKGVFAKEFIPKRTRVGPYKGEMVQKEDVTDGTDTSYFFEVKKSGMGSYYIDAKNEEHASWLRFINCARHEEEQNLLSFQYQGNIYCYTIKDILPGTELLVWYGEQYVKLLGLPVDQIIDSNYTCAHCHAQFVEKQNFNLYLRYSQVCRDANPQVFKCGKCGEVFTILINLQQHIRRHEQGRITSSLQEASYSSTSQSAIGSKCFRCKFCRRFFAKKQDLQEHLETHNGDRPYECQYCSKTFSVHQNLGVHIKIHTGEKPYPCQYCSKSFVEKGKLRQHLLYHTGEKPYQCQYCSKSFRERCNLKCHLLTHTGEKPHKCQYCPKAFADSSTLRKHLRTHTGERPYKCQYCSKAFKLYNALKYHLAIHTGEKPYKCQHCQKCFKAKYSLQQHLNTHIPEKPYKCPYCTKQFHHLVVIDNIYKVILENVILASIVIKYLHHLLVLKIM
ncbi:histone-lysine N-methyltransferase PRDM9-like [Dysidea avara]|uniref:histone-lysine N-methyltransferase PRDM9-like n=1 Tax=Dysidea avara TaxID=196820 RepID=UPI003321AA5B